METENKSVVSKDRGWEEGIDYSGADKTFYSGENIQYFSCGGVISLR